MMKRCGWMLLCWLGLAVGAAAAAEQYAVVRLTHLDRSVTLEVMAASDFKVLQSEIRAEAPVFGPAMTAAAAEWKEDERNTKQFPASSFGQRQAAVTGAVYDSREKAEAALARMPAPPAPPKSNNKNAVEQAERVAAAMVLLADQLEERRARVKGVAPGGVSTNKIALVAGQVLDRTTSGPLQTTYHVAVPDNYDAKKPPPLLVMFSPGGDGRGIMNAVKSSAHKSGWLVIGCDRIKNGMSDEESIALENELLEDFHEYIPYDPDRLYYGGFSGGAWVAYFMTVRHKDRARGILAFGGWLGGEEMRKAPFQKRLSVAIVNGDGDAAANSHAGSDKKALEMRKCEVKIFKFPGGHAIAPAPVVDEAIQWLDNQAGVQKK